MNILVTGGAGYIGSHMVALLLERGHKVCTLDNLSTGHASAVLGGEFVRGDIGDAALLQGVLSCRRFDAVMHFAAVGLVGESVCVPEKYFDINVSRSRILLDAVAEHNVKRFVFSSTAAVFGEPEASPINEAHPKRPLNPYGTSKLAVEELLSTYSRAQGMGCVSLRYFNAAGADPLSRIGEQHEPETHLIPLVLRAASGRLDHVAINGDDYGTPDGTCVRDYVHVCDLCNAHLLALEWIKGKPLHAVFNLGNGEGFSVKQVIDAAAQVIGRRIDVRIAPRRRGILRGSSQILPRRGRYWVGRRNIRVSKRSSGMPGHGKRVFSHSALIEAPVPGPVKNSTLTLSIERKCIF